MLSTQLDNQLCHLIIFVHKIQRHLEVVIGKSTDHHNVKYNQIGKEQILYRSSIAYESTIHLTQILCEKHKCHIRYIIATDVLSYHSQVEYDGMDSFI